MSILTPEVFSGMDLQRLIKSERVRQWRHDHPDRTRQYQEKRLKKLQKSRKKDKKKSLRQRDVKRSLIAKYKASGCQICGYNKCPEALDFHHKNKDQKGHEISELRYRGSVAKLQRELACCIVVCANCHREIHHLVQ